MNWTKLLVTFVHHLQPIAMFIRYSMYSKSSWRFDTIFYWINHDLNSVPSNDTCPKIFLESMQIINNKFSCISDVLSSPIRHGVPIQRFYDLKRPKRQNMSKLFKHIQNVYENHLWYRFCRLLWSLNQMID